MNSADIYVLKESIRLVENKVRRDFVELENLQSTRKNVNFVNSTLEYLNDRLYSFLIEKRPKYAINIKGYKEKPSENTEFSIYVNSLCGINNLLHGIPYFATVISLAKNSEVVAGLVNNYAGNETFVAMYGKGAFVNDRRIRVSNRTMEDSALVAIKQDRSGKLFREIISKFSNFRINSCYALDFCCVACGKYDASVVFGGGEEELKLGALFSIEAGGLYQKIGESGNDMIFSNYILLDSIKNIIV
ncbi:MAG: hypothetical protein LBP39_01640 [Rickettsiales bacterium]|jgi:myo-inositol-1(or 4)-monophosphatase|nr:hypothetical protein [Rickettsiales bacterium]